MANFKKGKSTNPLAGSPLGGGYDPYGGNYRAGTGGFKKMNQPSDQHCTGRCILGDICNNPPTWHTDWGPCSGQLGSSGCQCGAGVMDICGHNTCCGWLEECVHHQDYTGGWEDNTEPPWQCDCSCYAPPVWPTDDGCVLANGGTFDCCNARGTGIPPRTKQPLVGPGTGIGGGPRPLPSRPRPKPVGLGRRGQGGGINQVSPFPTRPSAIDSRKPGGGRVGRRISTPRRRRR